MDPETRFLRNALRDRKRVRRLMHGTRAVGGLEDQERVENQRELPSLLSAESPLNLNITTLPLQTEESSSASLPIPTDAVSLETHSEAIHEDPSSSTHLAAAGASLSQPDVPLSAPSNDVNKNSDVDMDRETLDSEIIDDNADHETLPVTEITDEPTPFQPDDVVEHQKPTETASISITYPIVTPQPQALPAELLSSDDTDIAPDSTLDILIAPNPLPSPLEPSELLKPLEPLKPAISVVAPSTSPLIREPPIVEVVHEAPRTPQRITEHENASPKVSHPHRSTLQPLNADLTVKPEASIPPLKSTSLSEASLPPKSSQPKPYIHQKWDYSSKSSFIAGAAIALGILVAVITWLLIRRRRKRKSILISPAHKQLPPSRARSCYVTPPSSTPPPPIATAPYVDPPMSPPPDVPLPCLPATSASPAAIEPSEWRPMSQAEIDLNALQAWASPPRVTTRRVSIKQKHLSTPSL